MQENLRNWEDEQLIIDGVLHVLLPASMMHVYHKCNASDHPPVPYKKNIHMHKHTGKHTHIHTGKRGASSTMQIGSF